jgi:hypothetical protein
MNVSGTADISFQLFVGLAKHKTAIAENDETDNGQFAHAAPPSYAAISSWLPDRIDVVAASLPRQMAA